MRYILCFVAVWTGILAHSVEGALVVDLRFPDGSRSKPVAAGDHDVYIWAQVTGTNDTADERLLSLFGSVQSQQSLGGVVNSGTSGVNGTSAMAPFSVTAPSGQPGTAQNFSADGVGDWGTTSGKDSIKFNSCLDSGLIAVDTSSSTAVWNATSGGVEFLVGKFTVNIKPSDVTASPLANAATRFTWVKGTGPIPTSHSHYIDGATTATTSGTSYAASTAANAVSFTAAVPEPAVIGVIGLGMIFAFRRRGIRA